MLLACLLAVTQQVLSAEVLTKLSFLPCQKTKLQDLAHHSVILKAERRPAIHTCANSTFQYLKDTLFFHGVGTRINLRRKPYHEEEPLLKTRWSCFNFIVCHTILILVHRQEF